MSETPDPFEGMPLRFDYIKEVVLRFARRGRNHAEDEWRRSLSSLSPQQLRVIAGVYERLAENDETASLLKWIHGVAPKIRMQWRRWQRLRDECEEHGRPIPPEPPQAPRAASLFELFKTLADLGAEPFVSRLVRYEDPAPDWSNLPARLHYLIEPALRWGGSHQFYEQIDELARTIGLREMGELRALASRLRDSGDWSAALDWTSSLDWEDHREAALVHWLLNLLHVLSPSVERSA